MSHGFSLGRQGKRGSKDSGRYILAGILTQPMILSGMRKRQYASVTQEGRGGHGNAARETNPLQDEEVPLLWGTVA